MALTSVIIPTITKPENIPKEITSDLNSFVYLPKEGLQGENIPSHLLWMNAKLNSAKISFGPPLKLKEIFNVEKYVIKDNVIEIQKLETEGYIGLEFETEKVDELQIVVPVEYHVIMKDGSIIEDTKDIRLFKPKIEVEIPKKHKIEIESKTGFVKGRIKIRNIGRGTLLIKINTADQSQFKIITPPEHREISEKFNTDLDLELKKLSEEFPHFKPLYNEMEEWNLRDYEEVFRKDGKIGKEFLNFMNKLANTLANDKELLQGFVESYVKAAAKNSEFVEAFRRMVKILESMVTYDIFLTNPLDEIRFDGKPGEILLEISQTDKVYGEYDDIKLPSILVQSSGEIKVPIYRLFEWG